MRDESEMSKDRGKHTEKRYNPSAKEQEAALEGGHSLDGNDLHLSRASPVDGGKRDAIKMAAVMGTIALGSLYGVSGLAAGVPQHQKIPPELILPNVPSDPFFPEPGQIWYRTDLGVAAYYDAVNKANIRLTESSSTTAVTKEAGVTVSSKGIVNGLSTMANDGADFGPDTLLGSTSPGQYGPPFTQTSGIQEALNYAQSELQMYFPPQFSSPVSPIYYNVKKVKLLPGLFNITSPVVLPFYGVYDGYLAYLPNELEGSGPLATFIKDAASSGLSAMITINPQPTGGVPNQEVHQENFNYIGNFSLVANSNNTQYGLELNIGDDPPHATIEHINFIGNFTKRALWYSGDESFMHYLSFFNTNNAVNATIYAPGGVAYADHLYASGFNYLNLEIAGSQVYISDSLINALKIDGDGDFVLSNIWFGNNSGIGYLIGIFGGFRGLYINNSHLKAYATSATASQSPPIFYLGYVPSSSPSFGVLKINSFDMTAFQGVAGAVTMLSGDTSGNEWLTKQFAYIDAYTAYSGFAIATSEFISLNGRWIGNPTTPAVPASGTAQQNLNPFPVNVYVYGGGVTEIQYTPNGGSGVEVGNTTPAMIRLNPGDSLTLRYSSAPSWAWVAL
jgi:hypothetical protein